MGNVLAAIVLNVVIAGILFYASDGVTRIPGLAGTRGLSKMASLFLAAIAVMMVREGVLIIVNNLSQR